MNTRIRCFAGLSLVGVLLLTACAGMDEAAEEAVDDLPIDPEQIEEAILEEAESDDDEDRFENPTTFGINGAWFTPNTFEKTDLNEAFAGPGEALTVSLQIDASVLDVEDAREFGIVADDPRFEDYGGYVDTSLIGDSYDVNAPLSLASPTIYIGRFSAYLATMNGLLIAEQNQLTELTNSWAIDQAIAIYDAL